MNKYTIHYFKQSLPEWKRKKDSFLVRHFHGPLSFVMSSFFVKLNMTANMVSAISLVVGILASICYLFDGKITYFIGAVLLNIWMVLDCADGNIARSVQRQPFGEFIDATSGYALLGNLFICMGVAAYRCDGLLITRGNFWIVIIGAIASESDTLGRLLYQKYINQEVIINRGNLQETEAGTESVSVGRLRKIEDRIDKELGLNGIFLPIVILVSLFKWFDVFLIFYMIFNMTKLLGTMYVLMKKAMRM